MHARARTAVMRWSDCCGSRYSVALLGYEDVNDAERLRHDSAMRWIIGGRAARAVRLHRARSAASRRGGSRHLRTFLRLPTCPADGLTSCTVEGRRVASARHGFEHEPDPWRAGEQRLDGHCECTCYHPLFVFNQFGDLERCALRPGNVRGADGWGDVLKPVVVRYQDKVLRI
jgi:Transposase DDE domain group 1